MDPVRIDKWLWAARFFKSRALAADAVKGGLVHLNGHSTKPSRDVIAGDRLRITTGRSRFTVDVLATAERRGPAAEAARLYAETEESRQERERRAEEARLARPVSDPSGARPTKRDRRRFEQTAGARRKR